ncbi:MAG: N-acetylmuramoyl-L-alanine amidase [Oscillospiraceae bacterium]|nr:N-acetylmuramoyl-L-alanine amidase [Oscillospiraceae bacterium]
MKNRIAAVLLTAVILTGCSSPVQETYSGSSEPVITEQQTNTAPETLAVVITEAALPDTESVTEAVTAPESELHTEAAGKLYGIKIGIDPGHQLHGNSEQEAIAPWNPTTKDKVKSGTTGVATGIPEYVTNLDLSLALRTELEAEGATVYMTRETHDVNLSNQERTKMMNEYGVDLMLRIHCDASDNPEATGIGLYVSESNAIAAQSYQYAQIIQPILCETVGAQNRGIVQNDNYTGQNWAEVPCIMIECGFMTNPEEDRLLNDPAYQEKLAEGIVRGIEGCFVKS